MSRGNPSSDRRVSDLAPPPRDRVRPTSQESTPLYDSIVVMTRTGGVYTHHDREHATMTYCTLKVSPERDAYLVLDTAAQEFLAWGTREEIEQDLFDLDDRKPERITPGAPSHPARRLDRADALGTDSYLRRGEWDEASVPYQQRSLLRDRLSEVYDRLVAWHEAREDPLPGMDPRDDRPLPDLSDLYLRY